RRHLYRVRVADHGQLGLVDHQGVALYGRRAVAVLPAHRGLDRGEAVDDTGALLEGGVTEVGRGASEQPLDQGRSRPDATVGLLVRLDHERGRARDERRGLAGTAEVLDPRRRALVVEALLEPGQVRRAQRPAEVTRRGQIRHPGLLRHTARREAGDVV